MGINEIVSAHVSWYGPFPSAVENHLTTKKCDNEPDSASEAVTLQIPLTTARRIVAYPVANNLDLSVLVLSGPPHSACHVVAGVVIGFPLLWTLGKPATANSCFSGLDALTK
jgi:hypothetical protein